MNNKKRLGTTVRTSMTVESSADVNERRLAKKIVNRIIKRKRLNLPWRVIKILRSETKADNLTKVEGKLRVIVPASMSVNVFANELRRQLDNTYIGQYVSIIVEKEKKSNGTNYEKGMHRRKHGYCGYAEKKLQRKKENDDGSGTGGRHGKK